jgi:hypothetical protein
MKTTLELPDDLFRRSKATAALRGESLKDFVAGALRERLERRVAGSSGEPGWRRVFGKARPEDVAAVDAVVEEHLERVDPDEWR